MDRRNTIQRDMVLQAVNRLRCHATADDIYALISDEYPSIGKGTVYRNLNILVQEGKIRKVSFPGDPDRFDHDCSQHYHVKCIRCGKVFDVDMEEVTDLASRIRNTHGIEFIDYDILFRGVCPSCLKEQNTES